MTVSSSSVEKVNESERPSGAVLVAAHDLYIPATDANGNPVRHGSTFVAAAGHRIPSAYLEHPEVKAGSVKASEYEPPAPAEAAAADADEPSAEATPISRMTRDELLDALEAEGVEHDPDANVPTLRDTLKVARDADGE